MTDTGIDYDLSACLAENPQSFGLDDVARVLGCVEGEKDGVASWWLLELRDGRPALLTGEYDFPHAYSTGHGVELLIRRDGAAIDEYRLVLTPARARYLARQLVMAAELEGDDGD